ncbi:MAG: hypothetical protein MJY72_08790 [Bacteroidales bacterium]|nr:hypothetical protein [Bacteroidales bacterium]
MKIYVASSWRNPHYPAVVAALRDAGFDVYDFRNPGDGEEPELMYKLFDSVTCNIEETIAALGK